MCMVDQLPCGSVLTPAISCTKFKIHSVHDIVSFFFNLEGGPVSASQTMKLRKRMCMVDNSLVGQYLHQLSLLQSSRSIQRMQPKHCFFLLNFEGGPLFASQTKKLRKRMYMVDQLPCGSVLTPAIFCTKFKIHSAHADSPLTKTLFVSFQF